MAYIEFNGVVKEYPTGDSAIRALDGASFTADEGELSVILGQSGAGKTTALNILGGMDTATGGTVVVGSRGMHSALENVELASQICADHFDPAQTLDKVGLGDRLDNFPAQLSGGEQQRVSIARAVAKKPKLLLCDEPTGALDYETGKEVLQLLQDICHDEHMTVLIITHNSALAPMAHKIIRFRSGKVISQEINEHPTPISDIEW